MMLVIVWKALLVLVLSNVVLSFKPSPAWVRRGQISLQGRETAAVDEGQSSSFISKPNVIKFDKYQGLGNDFILALGEPPASFGPETAKQICDRNFGVGADGIIFAEKNDEGAWRMNIYNSDGTQPEMCGNGIR